MLWLQNDTLQVGFLPKFGGKIASLRSRRTGEEFLLPPLTGYHHVPPGACFSESDGGGFDECLPSVASCESDTGRDPVPDHGDLWRLSWVVESSHREVTLRADATSRPLRLTRKATLQGSSLILDYDLFNLSDSPATWLWSAHPLFQVDSGDRIVLPKSVERVGVEYSAGDIFLRNMLIDWPRSVSTSGVEVDLSVVGGKDGITAHKVFASMSNGAGAGLYRANAARGLFIRFDPATLPFLGI